MVVDITSALAVGGYMAPEELLWLAEQAQRCHLVIEVGSYLGRSTRALADHCPGTVWAVDDWRGDPGVPDDPINGALPRLGGPDAARALFTTALTDHLASGRVQLLAKSSVLAARELFMEYGAVFDLVFLDASHDVVSVRADLLAYRPLVRPGGLLAGHDRDWPGVQQAVQAVLGGYTPGPGAIWIAPEE